jgi:predicted acetyltransferase
MKTTLCGYDILIDDEDSDLLSIKWSALKFKGQKEKYSFVKRDNFKHKTLSIHREICARKYGIGFHEKCKVVLTGDWRDFRRQNIIISDSATISKNKSMPKFTKRIKDTVNEIKYKGVYETYWRSKILYHTSICLCRARKTIWIGTKDTQESAAREYDKYAMILFKDRATLNFPNEIQWSPDIPTIYPRIFTNDLLKNCKKKYYIRINDIIIGFYTTLNKAGAALNSIVDITNEFINIQDTDENNAKNKNIGDFKNRESKIYTRNEIEENMQASSSDPEDAEANAVVKDLLNGKEDTIWKYMLKNKNYYYSIITNAGYDDKKEIAASKDDITTDAFIKIINLIKANKYAGHRFKAWSGTLVKNEYLSNINNKIVSFDSTNGFSPINCF